MLQVTSRREGRHLSPCLPMGGAHKALLWWKGHQLDLPLGACASYQCFALGGVLLEGMCCSITGSSIPSMEVATCQGCLVDWQLLSQT